MKVLVFIGLFAGLLVENVEPTQFTYAAGNGKLGKRNVTVDIQVDPTDSTMCLFVSADNHIRINNAQSTESSSTTPMRFPCATGPNDAFNGGYNTAVDLYDYILKTKSCLETTVGFKRFWEIGKAGVLQGQVHYGSQWVNAKYNGQILCGDGLNDRQYPFCTAPDTVAHEIGHGVSSLVAGLGMSGETGCINEAFSDMTGKLLDYCLWGTTDWLARAQFNRLIGADYANHSYTDKKYFIWNYADYTTGLDPHDCSGIYNHAIYLLSTTAGWTQPKAYQIFYGGLKYYFGSTPTMKQGLCGMLKYAVLTGLIDKDIQDIVNAFKAVGLTVDSSQCPLNNVVITTFPYSEIRSLQVGQVANVYGDQGKTIVYKLIISGTFVGKNMMYMYILARDNAVMPADFRVKSGSPPTSYNDWDGTEKVYKINKQNISVGVQTQAYITCPSGDYYVMVKFDEEFAVELYSVMYDSEGLTCPTTTAAPVTTTTTAAPVTTTTTAAPVTTITTAAPVTTTNVASLSPTLSPLAILPVRFTDPHITVNGQKGHLFAAKFTWDDNMWGTAAYWYFNTINEVSSMPLDVRVKYNTVPKTFDDYDQVYYGTNKTALAYNQGFVTQIVVYCAPKGDYYVMLYFVDSGSVRFGFQQFVPTNVDCAQVNSVRGPTTPIKSF